MKPSTGAAAKAIEKNRGSETAPSQHKNLTRSILIVDDEESIRTLLREVVITLGYQPLTASNGLKALELMSTASVDLVITDIHMPGISGLDLLKQVKETQPQLPVVLITGFSLERAARTAQELHADGFLGKPFQIDELRHCIRRLID